MMNNKVITDLHKHVKQGILDGDSKNFNHRAGIKGDVFITKHARRRCNERGVSVSDALVKKNIGNVIIGNTIVTNLGERRDKKQRVCDSCYESFMTSYEGSNPVCYKHKKKKKKKKN